MGLGDNLMASGMARGFAARGRFAAFGDGKKILWDTHSSTIFRNNPNVARPGMEGGSSRLDWIHFHKGRRIYNSLAPSGDRWIWNYDFRAQPGEIYLSTVERDAASRFPSGRLVMIEPNLPWHKSCAPNKEWPALYYERVASDLRDAGWRVIQVTDGKARHVLRSAEQVTTQTFRIALAVMARAAALYVGPEGGLHHGAAALGVPAVVLFGGFIPPQITGYEGHVNMTGDSREACGRLTACLHCRRAMLSIAPESVTRAALGLLGRRAA